MLAFLIGLAVAGELVVMSDTRVSVEVDGRPVSAPGGERGSLAVGLAGGLHRVQVFDGKDRLLASATSEVGSGEQVRLELRQGRLVELGRGQLAGVCVGEQASASQGSLSLLVGAPGLSGSPEEGAVVVVVGGDRAAPAAAPAAAQAPAAAPLPVAPVAVTGSELASISGAIEGEAFSSDKLGVLRAAVGQRWFSIEQVGSLLDLFAHSSDKVAAAGVLAPRTLDPQNAYRLDEHLSFSSDKAAVRRLYAR